MQVYRIGLYHYIRAESALRARVRAFKVWGYKDIQPVAIGQEAPEIGRSGYNEAAHNAPLFIARNSTGKVSDRVSAHKAKAAGPVCITNSELAALYAASK